MGKSFICHHHLWASQLDEDMYDIELHRTIVLRYDSTFKKNMSGPIKNTKDAEVTFKFTVKQRKFAKDAKTAGSLDGLEESVCPWFLSN